MGGTKNGSGEVDGAKADAVAKKLADADSGECAFSAGGSGAVCSPKHVVDKMKQFAKVKGKTAVVAFDDRRAVETVKDLLNCNSESCILKRPDFQEFARLNNIDALLDSFFKPAGPKGFGLLSNFNIDDVLDQFVKRFESRKFLHIPFQMRDFQRVGTKLSTVNLAREFKGGARCFGVVLNTDVSTGRGIHWFCLFGEHYGDQIVLEYFNSSGRPPLPEVQAWLLKTKHHLAKEMKLPVDIWYSTGIQFQDDDHSCGVYCLCYIWLRLERVSPKWFKSTKFNDSLMHRARDVLFRQSE
jgi:hypothetical protein